MNNRNLFTELEKLLRMDSTYCTEDGTLLKNIIVIMVFRRHKEKF